VDGRVKPGQDGGGPEARSEATNHLLRCKSQRLLSTPRREERLRLLKHPVHNLLREPR
jgi:hypothetical protein